MLPRMDASDIESLERATVEGVAPPEVLELDGWLLPLADGGMGRAKSAVPLRHDIGPGALDGIIAAYRERGLPPAFRMATVASLAPVRAALAERGFAAHQPTVVKTGSIDKLSAFSEGSVRILDRPDEAWTALFAGDGFELEDSLYRAAALARSPGAAFAAAGPDGETHAVGVMSFGFGWAGVHGMRTGPAHRGKGYAGAILAALGREARTRGVERVFLDVEEGNHPARRIYAAAGFAAIWGYQYWR